MPTVVAKPPKPQKSWTGVPALRLVSEPNARFAFELAADLKTTDRIDRDAGVIRKVKLVGIQSNNLARTIGYSYGDVGPAANQPYSYAIAGLRRSMPLYENTSVYQNHLPFKYDRQTGSREIVASERPNDQLLGWIKNVYVVETGNPETDGLYGDFHFIRTHSYIPNLIEVAERNPEKLALSHEAYFDDVKVVNGRLVIQELKKVAGMALVNQEPGTTKSLFESHFQEPHMPTATLRQVLESSVGDEAQVKSAKLLLELMSGPPFDTVGDAPAPDQMAVATPAAPVTADQAIKEAFKTAVIACFEDPSLDMHATIEKIDNVLNAMETIAGPALPIGGAAPLLEGDAPPEGEGDEPPAAEGDEPPADKPEGDEPPAKKKPFAKESTDVDRGPLIIESCGLMVAAGLTPTPELLESVAAKETPEKRQAFVSELKALIPEAPASGAPKKPIVPVPRSTVPTPGVNPSRPVAESKIPDYVAGELSKGFFQQ